MTKRMLAGALAAVALAGVVTAAGAGATAPSPTPKPIAVPGGLAPDETHAVAGDCELDAVTCKPARAGSCTPRSGVTTTTPPTTTTTIKVLVRTPDTDTVTITSVPFLTYVENVLPREWVATWDGDARKAGAVAVKTYAWYWMSHFGGYLNGDPTQCFDVTDDADFQVYRAGSATAATNSSISQTWPVFARKGGQVFQTQYRDTLTGSTKEVCGAGANGATLSQYGSQNCNDPDLKAGGSTANKYNVILQRYYGTNLQLATTAQLHANHDFQYLARSTPATFANGVWTVADGYPTRLAFGAKGDIPVVNTVGDGFARVGVFRPSTATWYLGTPTGTVTSKIAFGAKGDTPVAAHYQSLTGATQLAVFRPSTAVWYLATPTGHVASKIQYGAKGDIPVPGIWTGTTTDRIAIFRPSTGTWWIRGVGTVRYGQKGDIPLPADYDGNGATDIAIYRPSTHQFWVRGHAPVTWGVAGDIPVTGDYNGDGKADLEVYRPSNHTLYVRGQTTVQLPAAGTPIGAAPYHQ